MKFRSIRTFTRKTGMFINGYTRHIAVKGSSADNETCTKAAIQYSLPIKIRPELGDQNIHRIHNMKLCCDMIDGTVLQPGTIFSLEHSIGEATAERGFKTGPVIIRGALGVGFGGGVCQVSTVLFNTALLANLKIIEKHCHSRDIWGEARMIDLGRDAVYVFLRKNLIFQNCNNFNLVLKLELNTDRTSLTGSILIPDTADTGIARIESETLQSRHNINDVQSVKKVRTRRISIDRDGIERITYDKFEKYRV
jgi:vancomycin resistance protein VanW